MSLVAHVLCPVDFSEGSRHALHQALAVTRLYRARLTVLHVVGNLPSPDLPPIVLTAEERGRVLQEVERFVGDANGASVQVLVQEAPDARAEILVQAGVLGADLIVMGSHGRSGFQRLLLGSVTEHVMRRAACPVLIVPPKAPDIAVVGPGRGEVTRILCAVDYSDGSLAALDHALSLAHEAGAELTLLHVIEVPPELAEPMPPSGDFDVEQVRAAAEATHLRRLRALVPDAVRRQRRVETVVMEGAAYRQILRCAEERAAALVVVGVQGRGLVDRLLFGSNAQYVVRAARCPVLVVPPGAQSASEGTA